MARVDFGKSGKTRPVEKSDSNTAPASSDKGEAASVGGTQILNKYVDAAAQLAAAAGSTAQKGNFLDDTDKLGGILTKQLGRGGGNIRADNMALIDKHAEFLGLSALTREIRQVSGATKPLFGKAKTPQIYNEAKQAYWVDIALCNLLDNFEPIESRLKNSQVLLDAWKTDRSSLRQRLVSLLLVPKGERLAMIQPLFATLRDGEDFDPRFRFLDQVKPWFQLETTLDKSYISPSKTEQYLQFIRGIASNPKVSIPDLLEALSWYCWYHPINQSEATDRQWNEVASLLGQFQAHQISNRPQIRVWGDHDDPWRRSEKRPSTYQDLLDALPTQAAKAKFKEWCTASKII